MINRRNVKRTKLKGGKVERFYHNKIKVDVWEDQVYKGTYVVKVPKDPYPCFWGNRARAVEAAYLLVGNLKKNPQTKQVNIGKQNTDYNKKWNCPSWHVQGTPVLAPYVR